MKKMLGIAFVSAAALVLAACGSSDNGTAAPGTTPVAASDVPASAQQSSSGLTAYLNALIATTSDNGEPVLLGDATLTADDTTETSL